MIILGIVLVRGLGAWMKRRNKLQHKSAPATPAGDRVADSDVKTIRIPGLNIEIPLPRPPSPPRDEEPPAPVPEAPDWERHPPEEAQIYEFKAVGGDLVSEDEEDSQRQTLTQRRANATAEGSETTRPAGLDVDHAARPRASEAEHIHREKLYANELLRILRSRSGIRHAVLLREVLGPPVALRSSHR